MSLGDATTNNIISLLHWILLRLCLFNIRALTKVVPLAYYTILVNCIFQEVRLIKDVRHIADGALLGIPIVVVDEGAQTIQSCLINH